MKNFFLNFAFLRGFDIRLPLGHADKERIWSKLHTLILNN